MTKGNLPQSPTLLSPARGRRYAYPSSFSVGGILADILLSNQFDGNRHFLGKASLSAQILICPFSGGFCHQLGELHDCGRYLALAVAAILPSPMASTTSLAPS